MSRSLYLTRKLFSLGTTALTTALVLGAAAPAIAAWSVGGTGAAAGAGTTMPAGNPPVVAVSGTDVSVRWPASSFPNGAAVEGYIVQRFDAASGQAATIGASCAGTVASTTCTENSVPPGTWVYEVTPIQGGWTGIPSPPSPSATVS